MQDHFHHMPYPEVYVSWILFQLFESFFSDNVSTYKKRRGLPAINISYLNGQKRNFSPSNYFPHLWWIVTVCICGDWL